MSGTIFALLVGAGVAAGLTGTIAGLASLFSYPALLAAGLPPTAANVTNTVSLAVGSVAAVHSSRRELVGQGTVTRRLGVVCVAGSAVGAALVLTLPAGVFERVVPFLVGGASVLIMVRRPSSADGSVPSRWRLTAGMFAVAVYNGYFAAASGVLILALLLATTSETLLRANALKNVLILLGDVIAAAGFALFGPVDWQTALPLTIGLLLGSWCGPVVARWVPTNQLRVGIALAGLGLAVKLAIDAF